MCKMLYKDHKKLQVSLPKSICAYALGQAKLIIRFPFPPACFLQVPQNFHYMAICTTWIFKYSQNFHYCIDEVFSQDFSHNE